MACAEGLSSGRRKSRCSRELVKGEVEDLLMSSADFQTDQSVNVRGEGKRCKADEVERRG
jgi:hypothetical protein